MNSKLFIY